MGRRKLRGRGAGQNPKNRFDATWREPDAGEQPTCKTVLHTDSSRTILAKNDSPDIPFTYSLNPYRGCEHGCIYCYARPTHEFLGYSAGLDFETQIHVKYDAPALLEQVFRKRTWEPQSIALSGNTDCYQPVEKELRLTRACLRKFLTYRNPVGIITKNSLVRRDVDLLAELAGMNLVHVFLSITTLRNDLANRMEPRTASPARRLHALKVLADASVPTGVMVAPVIPGLNDMEMDAILKAASEAGAQSAGYIALRLPLGVKPLFANWLEEHYPDRKNKVLNAVRSIRGGGLSDSEFFSRMRGSGERADLMQQMYDIGCKRHGLAKRLPPLDTTRFTRRPGQLSMFAPI